MEFEEGQKRREVIKIESKQTWDTFLYHAKNQSRPIVIHFTASWCIPSVAMTPVLAELALSYQNILFLSVDVDEVKEVAAKMEIKAMPTFMFMRDGVEVDKLVGANPEEIKKRIAAFIINPTT
ncbi:PREDICTED: thioredoxin-like protein CXXS1 [Ipomoea nil]|uniref:thioredoxin-like protein CXXS1 n=1 Tax=Ipomoea nil TaxID=35883 RepID=UPI000901D124|nr:PREDICTED: thioredoxin-like protein CXXS1 [Ipomoea nil]